MNVWKIGSRWGKNGPSVLDLFLDYECVFFNSDYEERLGDYSCVETGDFFIVCDGMTPVALAQATGVFQPFTNPNSRFHFTQDERSRFIDDYQVVICPAKIVILPQDERERYSNGYNQLRFCRYTNDAAIAVLDTTWERLTSPSEFDIIPKKSSLFGGQSHIFSDDVRYRIPRYQRPYSWGENELRKLLENLRDAVQTNAPVFMGTMQLSQPIPLDPNGTRKCYNIIDGQQRITTFMILLNVLEQKLNRDIIPYVHQKLRISVSGGEEQLKLDRYSEFITGNYFADDSNEYIQNFHTIEIFLDEYFSGETVAETVDIRNNLYDFIRSDKILFVTIETHAGLSKTLQIFNTINTAGMDLGATDLFKIRFYDYLKNRGEDDSIFDQISDIYASIEEYNRLNPSASEKLSMADVLRTYQRVICAKNGLAQGAFNKSYETFFEELFDTLLNIRQYPEFSDGIVLRIDDLLNIIACYKENYALLESDPHFHIIHNMIWETRYGYSAHDLPIIARFFNRIDQCKIFDFTLLLFKKLCPSSLCYAKKVNITESAILEISKAIAQTDTAWRTIICENFAKRGNPQEMLQEGCAQAIAHYPKWKNLICRLVEYLKSDDKDISLLKRLWSSIDIEHIQSATDENDAEAVWEHWSDEIDKMGNLILLESNINRSIKNHTQEKPDAYRRSSFVSARKLSDQVAGWQRENAEQRRRENTELLINFLLN